MNFVLDETTTKAIIGKTNRMKQSMEEHLLEHFEMKVMVVFLVMFP